MEPIPDLEHADDAAARLARTTAARYRRFGETETATSPTYRDWSFGVADDPNVIALIDTLPFARRQVNLVFAAARYCGAPSGPYAVLRRWLLAEWSRVRQVAMTHATQTNEAGRCAVLLPVLASLPGPFALLEVGASAGLCLYPDRYSYRFGDRPRLDPDDGPSAVEIDTATFGPVPVPKELPRVVWRAGIDLNPLDVRDDDHVAWLNALIWPEHDDRRERLHAAVDIASQSPPRIVKGDLNAELAGVAASAPDGATLVIFHTAVLAYLTAADRTQFVESVSALDAHWIANEGEEVVPGVAERLDSRPPEGDFVVSLDGRPVAFAQPHGRSIRWL